MENKVIIIGSGPAGLTAGIYTARSKLSPILIAGDLPGGQLTTTTKVENWPGIKEVLGPKLMVDMFTHAQAAGCEIIYDKVIKVDFSERPYKIFTQNGHEFKTKTIIIATGSSHKKLNIKGESEYWAKGVAVCATCDAPFFKDKEVIVVGGGNSAVTEAEHLSHFAKKVTIIHLLDNLTATDPIKDKVLVNPKIEILYNSTLKEILGDNQKVTEVLIENVKENKIYKKNIDGIFIAIGLKPNSEIFKDQLEFDNWGFIKKLNDVKTNKPGIFVAGDVSDFTYQQAITASGQGCMAALECERFLSK